MNDDLLSCKRQAVAMTNSEQPPLEKNGRKKGYIKIVRVIWDAKGYGELGYTNQNLRNQAARIEEKSLDGNSQRREEERMDSNSECQAIAATMSQENSKDGNYSDVSISISQAEYSMSQNAKNANSQETSFPDLHTIYSKAWFTLATEAEAETEAETKGSLRSSVNHENGDGSTSGSSTEAETEGMDRFLFLPSPLLLPSCFRRKLPSVNQY